MNASDKQGLLFLAALATVAFLALLSPMRSVLVWSMALAVIFGPRNERLAERLQNRNLAATLTVVLAIVTVMVPVTLIVYLSREQLSALAQGIATFSDQLPGHVDSAKAALSSTFGIHVNLGAVSERETAARLQDLENGLNTQVLQFGGAAITSMVEVFSTLYVLFFFLRDWRSIVGFITGLIPLKPEHKGQLALGMISVVNATLRGTIIVSAVQAGVAGLFYLALGIEVWALLAAVTFIFCLMPAIGSGAVWIPVAVYLLFTGHVFEFWIMVFGGTFIIGMIDNFLRPKLIGKETALPEFLIFLTSFGGLLLMGIDGLLLGPLVAKLVIELWSLYVRENLDSQQQPANQNSDGGQPPVT